MSADIQLAREALGGRLRALRRSTGLSGKDFAALLDWPQSKVSKLETGRQTPSAADIKAWAAAAGQPRSADALADELSELEQWFTEYRRRLRSGMRFRQREAQAAEARMRALRTFSNGRVPAFFQTPQYARHMLTLGARLYGAADDVDEAVSVRMRRQEVLYQPGKTFHIVITENVLRSCAVAPVPVMASQLDRLMTATGLASVSFGVIPFTTSWPVHLDHGFWLYDDNCVIVETLTAELRLTRAEEIKMYRDVFDKLAGIACYGQDARSLIARAAVRFAPDANTLPDS
ncbi:MAG: helix-turn-helix domain-containing protein [Streptosporangiaceae bacterium]